jgi:hypothetical protein
VKTLRGVFVSKKCTEDEDEDARDFRIESLQGFMLSISDQQLVTGLAMLVAGWARYSSITVYSMNIVSGLAFFASSVHIAAVRQKSIARKYRYINVTQPRTWPRFRDQMPHTNALSPPDLLPPTSTCAAYEYLCCPLRVPAAYLDVLNFAARSKKYLNSYR